MVYVYDILLNFNKDLIEFFEWLDTDNIKFAKKITLFKISTKTMIDFLNYDVEFLDGFINDTIRYELNGSSEKVSYTLFTDGLIVLGVSIKNNKIDLVSRLIIDEEDEIISMSSSLEEYSFDYRIIKRKEIDNNVLTRKELYLKMFLKNEIDSLYNNNDFDKLEYLYYEYTGNECKNHLEIYNYLIDSLFYINNKHRNLFDVLKKSKKV